MDGKWGDVFLKSLNPKNPDPSLPEPYKVSSRIQLELGWNNST